MCLYIYVVSDRLDGKKSHPFDTLHELQNQTYNFESQNVYHEMYFLPLFFIVTVKTLLWFT